MISYFSVTRIDGKYVIGELAKDPVPDTQDDEYVSQETFPEEIFVPKSMFVARATDLKVGYVYQVSHNNGTIQFVVCWDMIETMRRKTYVQKLMDESLLPQT